MASTRRPLQRLLFFVSLFHVTNPPPPPAPLPPPSSLATEMIKGKSIDECLSIKNSDIAAHLKLPPVKLHCRWAPSLTDSGALSTRL